MEEQQLIQKQLKTVRATYTTAKIFFILYLVFSLLPIIAIVVYIQQGGTYSFFSYLILSYLVQLFVLACIINSKGHVRKYWLGISMIVYIIFSLSNTIINFPYTDLGPAQNVNLGLSLGILYYAAATIFIILLYVKINGKKPVGHPRAFFLTAVALLIISITYESIIERLLDTVPLFSVISNAVFAFYFPFLVLFITYKSLQNKVFFFNFIINHPKSPTAAQNSGQSDFKNKHAPEETAASQIYKLLKIMYRLCCISLIVCFVLIAFNNLLFYINLPLLVLLFIIVFVRGKNRRNKMLGASMFMFFYSLAAIPVSVVFSSILVYTDQNIWGYCVFYILLLIAQLISYAPFHYLRKKTNNPNAALPSPDRVALGQRAGFFFWFATILAISHVLDISGGIIYIIAQSFILFSISSVASIGYEDQSFFNGFYESHPLPFLKENKPSSNGHHQFCTRCGSSMLPGSNFCPNCGSPQNQTHETN